MAHKLGHTTDLKTVILFAQSTFTHAHKDSAADIRKVDKEYEEKVKGMTDNNKIYTEFKRHYVAELQKNGGERIVYRASRQSESCS